MDGFRFIQICEDIHVHPNLPCPRYFLQTERIYNDLSRSYNSVRNLPL